MRRLPIAVAVAAIACIACSKPVENMDVVRIADRGFLTNAPIYIADEEGFFADERIKLDFSEPPRSSAQIIPLLERGDVDVLAPAVSAAFYAAVAQGARLRIVADRGHVSPTGCDYDGVVVRRGLFNGGKPTAEGFKGKRFSASPAGSAAFVIDKYLQSLGISMADVQMNRMAGERVEQQALEAGSIDAMHVAEPYTSILVGQGYDLVGPAKLYAPRSHYAVVVFGPTLTVEKRDVGHRFMKAYLRGVQQFREGHTPRNVEIMVRRSGVDADRIRKVCLPTVNADGELNYDSLLEFQQWLVSKGNLSRVLGAEAGTDMAFARKAAKELGIPPTPR